MDKSELIPLMSEDAVIYADRVLDVFDAPFARQMGIEIESVSTEQVVCRMKVEPFMINSMGRAHGAAIYALMDHTFAIMSNMVHDGTGQSMEVKYYRPASSELRCITRPLNISRSLGIYDVRVYSVEGKLIASATCTAFVLNKVE